MPPASHSPLSAPLPHSRGDFFCNDELRRARPAQFAARQEYLAACLGRQRPPQAAAPPSLEEATLNDQQELPDVIVGSQFADGELECRVVQYTDGVRASVYQFRSQRGKRSSVEDPEASVSSGSGAVSGATLTGDRLDASISRSKRLVLHRARCLGVHAMWTFTRRGKFASLGDLWAVWARFCRLMKKGRSGKRRWAYVAVPELHKDGETWHLHVLVNRFYVVETLRRLWYVALGGHGGETGEATPGNVDVKSLRACYSSARGAAAYISKYVGKGFERGGANRRVFACSIGLRPVDDQRWRDPYGAGLVGFVAAVERRLREHFGVSRTLARFFFRDLFEFAVIEAA